MRATTVLMCCLSVVGCASTHRRIQHQDSVPIAGLTGPRNVGLGPRFRPGPTGALVERAAPVDGMSCKPAAPVVALAHVEVFAAGHVVVIAAGIGVAPPLRRHGAYVRTGRCVYPIHTIEPTGLVLTAAGPSRRLGQLFDLWGQPLSDRDVAGFRAPLGQHVLVFIDGVPWPGNPGSAALSPNAQITVEVGSYVPPHTRYTFPTLQSLTIAHANKLTSRSQHEKHIP